MMRFGLTLLFSGLLLSSGLAVSLESLWEKTGIWEHTTETFPEVAGPLGFRWNSAEHDSARGAGKGLTLAGLPVVEVLVRFSGGKVSGLTAVIYARGDAGEMTRPEFDALVKRSVDTLSTLTGVRPQVQGKDAHNAVKADGVLWQTPQTNWLLEYAMARTPTPKGLVYQPNFVRLEMSPFHRTALSTVSYLRMDPKTHVKRVPAGDVWIDGIPMVDQGEKGYCVVATAERVLRYYGIRVDQNELAQLAGSDSRRGTSLTAAIEGLRQAEGRLHFHIRMVDEPDIKGFEALVADYNRRISKYGKGLQVPPLQGAIDPYQILGGMRVEVLREAKLNQKGAFTRFQRLVATSVDAGHPLVWGVVLGLAKEEGLNQSVGGHVRLIVGYNAAKNELLYSDSWGAGHELKRMSMEDAWLMHSFSLMLWSA